MLKNISSLGKSLDKTELKSINRGNGQCDYWTCVHWEILIFKPACYCDA